ncbi:MAG: BglII/BstYI family type II restriction endonuclease [Actinomycetes bacterium]
MAISQASIEASDKWDEVRALYECYDYHNCAAVLTIEFPNLFSEICGVLMSFRFTDQQVLAPGGNESQIPKVFSEVLRPLGWRERQFTTKLLVNDKPVSSDTHKVDYVKEQVAFDLEWNSKDQTFDRDLFAFRTFYQYRAIAAAVLVTRSNDLDPYFASLGRTIDKYGAERLLKSKYGASTTHLRKLLPRLDAGRTGGCPLLAIGITQKQREG